MFRFKELFQFTTKDYSYKNTIVTYLSSNILLGITYLFAYLIREYFISRVIAVLVIVLFIYLLIAFIVKIMAINDNKTKALITHGEYKSIFNPIDIDLDDIILWLRRMMEPETIVCSIKKQYFIIEISFDVKGRRGAYYNKQIFLNNEKVDLEKIIALLKKKAEDNVVKVYETFDKNRPEILVDEIRKIKEKNPHLG